MKTLCLVFIAICGCYTISNPEGTTEKPKEKTSQTAIRTSSRKSEGQTGKESYVARIYLASPRLSFSPSEPIPVEIIIETGLFDLLVPYSAVGSQGLLSHLIIKDQRGTLIEPRQSLVYEIEKKRLFRDGKKVECIPGMRLAAGLRRSVILENIQRHYELKSGTYTLQVLMHLKVFKETLSVESLLIHDAEERIARVQTKSKIAAHTRRKHIAGLQRFIKALQQQAVELAEIYLPLDSLRGTTYLQSNVLHLKIEGRD